MYRVLLSKSHYVLGVAGEPILPPLELEALWLRMDDEEDVPKKILMVAKRKTTLATKGTMKMSGAHAPTQRRSRRTLRRTLRRTRTRVMVVLQVQEGQGG